MMPVSWVPVTLSISYSVNPLLGQPVLNQSVTLWHGRTIERKEEPMAGGFEGMTVWQKAHELMLLVHCTD
jgi:hypothetical protein